MAKGLTERMTIVLKMVHAATESAIAENKRRHEAGRFRRVPVGQVAKGDHTLFALEKRGLLDKSASGFGIEPGQYVWTLTREGQEELNGKSA